MQLHAENKYRLQERLEGGVKKIRGDFKFTVEKEEEKLGRNHGLTPSFSVEFCPIV